MRKIICLLAALVLCLSVAAPVFAAENGFVPSITYKPNPEIVPVTSDEDGQAHMGVVRGKDGAVLGYVDHGCLTITPIAYVWDEEMEVPQEIENLLVFVYNALNEGGMELPYEKFEANLNPADMVIRDLFDVRWACEEHREMVEEEGVTFEVTFDLGVVADAAIFAMTYDEGAEEWSPIVKTVNNGDGTITCTFEHLCAVAFSMPMASATVAPTAEPESPNVLPWVVSLGVALAGVAAVFGFKKKKTAV